MREERVTAFVARIVEECAQEGLTIEEVLQIPQLLRFSVNDCVEKINRKTEFSAFQAVE